MSCIRSGRKWCAGTPNLRMRRYIVSHNSLPVYIYPLKKKTLQSHHHSVCASMRTFKLTVVHTQTHIFTFYISIIRKQNISTLNVSIQFLIAANILHVWEVPSVFFFCKNIFPTLKKCVVRKYFTYLIAIDISNYKSIYSLSEVFIQMKILLILTVKQFLLNSTEKIYQFKFLLYFLPIFE